MKLLLSLALLISFTTSSFANCVDAYQDAAFNRELRNNTIIVVGVVALAVTAAILNDGESSSLSSSNNNNNNGPTVIVHNHHNHYYHNPYYYDYEGYYTHDRYGHSYYNNHYHRSYGSYYTTSTYSEDRWEGNNNFDKVLKAYNDALVWRNMDSDNSSSYALRRLNKRVAKKVKRLARKQGKKDLVADIINAKRLENDSDKLIVRDTLLTKMENKKYCSEGKRNRRAMKRIHVIRDLAQAIIDARESNE
jgi:hypothetical protein